MSTRAKKARLFSWQYSTDNYQVSDPTKTTKPKYGIGLLKSGHLLQPCLIGGKRYLFFNTCAIDAIIQSLAAAFVDYNHLASETTDTTVTTLI